MSDNVLVLPEMPDNHCIDAALARVFVEEAVTHLVELNTASRDARVDDDRYTDPALQHLKNRIKMASDFLIDYTIGCENCSTGDTQEDCPMVNAFDFVRSIAEVRRIMPKPSKG